MTSIYSWNINGIRAVLKKGNLQYFLDTYSPDIVCLQEIKAYKAQVPADFENYFEYWNSAERGGYSGTAIFSKKEALSVQKDIPQDIAEKYQLQDQYGNTNSEGRVIAVEFIEYFVVSVYTPNAKADLTRLPMRHLHWDPAFLEYMKRLEKTKPVIFCGDLNVAHTELDLARPKENIGSHGFTHEEREGIDTILKTGFIDTFRQFNTEGGQYTWWSNWGGARGRNIGWRIDYGFVSTQLKENLVSAEILPEVMGSDHCPIKLTLK